MVDSFTESTPGPGFLQSIGDSIKGVLVGVVILLVGTCCLPFNEYRYVKRMKALEGGLAQTEAVPSDKVDATKEGKLVLVSGTAETDETLGDDKFGVEVPAMRLVREVEMFQFKEESKTTGRKKKKKTTYSYPKKWLSSHEDSSKFKSGRPKGIHNPSVMPYSGENWSAESVALGAFDVPKGYIGSFSASQKVNPGGGATPAASPAASPVAADPLACPICQNKLKTVDGVKSHMAAKHKGETAKPPAGGNGGGAAPNAPAGFKAIDGYLYSGKGTSASPEIGDLRVSWSYAPPKAEATIVGKQVGSSFASFEINDSDVSGMHMGIETVKQYYAAEQASNNMMLFAIRIFGTIMMCVAFGMIFAPLSAVTDIIPIIGDVVDMGTGCAAAGLGVVASMILMALGWVFSRPMIGIPLFLIGIGGLVGLIILAKKMVGDKKKGGGDAPAPAPAAPAPAPPAPPAPEAPAA